jgi:hypothetical protein
MPSSLSVLFVTGRYFVPDEGEDMIVIARYAHNNEPSMIATKYGNGCVFLSSPQLEYEENSERDGTDYKDHFDDPDSEWPLMLMVSQWLIESSIWGERPTNTEVSTTNTNGTISSFTTDDTDTLQIPAEQIAMISGIAIVGIVLVLVVYAKRYR